jgi:hypothetical protein
MEFFGRRRGVCNIRRYSIQRSDTEHGDTQHNDTQHGTLSIMGLFATLSINDTQHK